MPHYTNNYEFEPLDLDADGYLDLVTVNDGPETGNGLAEHAFRNDHLGAYVDSTAQWWPPDANTGCDDAVVVGLDIESDGDADFIIGSLDGPDRLLVNDGTGALTLNDDVFQGPPSLGTVGLAVADLKQTGVWTSSRPRARPHTTWTSVCISPVNGCLTTQHHPSSERNSSTARSWREFTTTARRTGPATGGTSSWTVIRKVAMGWYGEHLFRAPASPGMGDAQVCATDAAGNRTCMPIERPPVAP